MSLELALKFTLPFEGGYSYDKDDPGGETKYGIDTPTFDMAKSKGLVKSQTVKDLTLEEAQKIYEELYYKPAKCDEMPAWLAVMVFDTAVNQGIGTAIRLLQQALNKFGADLTVDGEIGAETLGAIKKAIDKPKDLITWFCTFRALRYVFIITANKRLEKFAPGWFRRTLALQLYAFDLLNNNGR